MDNLDNNQSDRRPLNTRKNKLAIGFASFLARKNITPNKISVLSVVMAIISAIFFLLMTVVNADSFGFFLLPLCAGFFIQMRLLCNMLDGMVAIENKIFSPVGELYNEIPDRLGDLFIILGAGIATINSNFQYGFSVSIVAFILAFATAYIRAVGASVKGGIMDFSGPQAKPHRMALLTLGCILTMFEHTMSISKGSILYVILIIISLGCCITIYRRLRNISESMKKNNTVSDNVNINHDESVD